MEAEDSNESGKASDMALLQRLMGKASSEPVGFSIEEVMSGEHEFEPGVGPEGRFPFEFHVVWGPKDLGEFLRPGSEVFMTNDLEGRISVEGLCRNVPCAGRLELRYFKDRSIRYSFEFETGGSEYRFVGEKVNIWPWNLAVSHTTCFGVITEKQSGRLVSRSVSHFRLRSLPGFLASLRLT